MKTSALIVTYNSAQTIIECLQSIANQVDEIIVCDNGSRDQTLQRIHNADISVTLLEERQNHGYGTAVNICAKSAKGDVFLVLNPDTVVPAGAVEVLKTTMEETKAGIVGPEIRNADGTRYPSPRAFPRIADAAGHGFVGLVSKDNRWSRRYLQTNEPPATISPVDWVSGSAMLIRKSTFVELGGFDEAFFLYMEDVDICKRAHGLGWPVIFTPNAHVVHHQGVSSTRHPYRAVVAHHRSLITYTNRTTSGPGRIFLPVIWCGIVARGCVVAAKTLAQRGHRRHPSE